MLPILQITFRMFRLLLTLGLPRWEQLFVTQTAEDKEQTTDSLMRDALGLMMIDPGLLPQRFTILDFENRRTKAYEKEAEKSTLPVLLTHEVRSVEEMARSLQTAPGVQSALRADIVIKRESITFEWEKHLGDKRLAARLIAGPHIFFRKDDNSARRVMIFKSVPRLHDAETIISRAGYDLEAAWAGIANNASPVLVLVEELSPHRTLSIDFDSSDMFVKGSARQMIEEELIELNDRYVDGRMHDTGEMHLNEVLPGRLAAWRQRVLRLA